MSQVIDGHRNVLTRSSYMGEEGIGYGWTPLSDYGDYSAETHGRLQGYTEPCRIEILMPGAELAESVRGDMLLYLPAGVEWHTAKGDVIQDRMLLTDGGPLPLDVGLEASEAIDCGIAHPIA